MEYLKDLQKAQNLKQENLRFYQKLKKQKPKNLDDVVHELHHEVFEEIDCLKCANCCKTTSPIFTQKDIERIAKRLKMRPGDFIEKYLHVDEDNHFVLNQAPCAFLDYENYCTIYNDRPSACREYPHTQRVRFYQVAELSYNNTLICPAVSRITEKLKAVFS
jgi:uncharacterized protein